MTITEEIIVSGEDFIERQIILCPQQDDIEELEEAAYGRGYHKGWVRGLVMALAVTVAGALCVWVSLL